MGTVCVRNGYNVHPCGSRGDVGFLADFSVGLNAGQMRGASLEGNAGYKRVWEIERELGRTATWSGADAFKGTKQPWLRRGN